MSNRVDARSFSMPVLWPSRKPAAPAPRLPERRQNRGPEIPPLPQVSPAPAQPARKHWRAYLPKLTHAPTENALKHLASTWQVQVTETLHWIAFTPQRKTDLGLIFYPGALVDSRAYAPIARRVAEKGYQVVIVNRPPQDSFVPRHQARRILSDFPHIRQWAIAGHSLGGIAAAEFARSHPQAIQALICHAAYPITDMSRSALPTLILLGSEDKLIRGLEFFPYRNLMPQNTRVQTLAGANHAQFGDYGPQWGDGAPRLTRRQQEDATVARTLHFLKTAFRPARRSYW